MAVKYDINETRTDLTLPKSVRKSAVSFVRTGGGKDGAFGAMYDFWFGCVAWAVAKGLAPVDLPAAERAVFVSAGRGENHIQLAEWQVSMLIAAYLSTKLDVLDSEDLDPSALSVDAASVIKHANRLAAAGAEPFFDALKSKRGTSITPVLATAAVIQELRDDYLGSARAQMEDLIRPVPGGGAG